MPAHEPTGQPRRQDTTLRIATMNVLSPSHANWPVRRLLLKECLTGAYDGAGGLIGPGYHIVRHSRSAPDCTGAVLASRWPLVVLREPDLDVSPRTSTDSRYSTLIAEVHAPASWGNFLMVHHKPVWQHGYERERELQAVVTAREVERLLNNKHRHVILAETSTLRPTPPASDSGPACSPWKGSASPTRTHGPQNILMNPATHSARTIRWSATATCRWIRAGGSLTP
jgi:hypothetical protein